jgi:transcriptional regulator with XRE-family HTH domain
MGGWNNLRHIVYSVPDDEDGRVYISFDDGSSDPDSDEPLFPCWYGRQFLDSEPHVVEGPQFNDASEAVRWWLDRGGEWIIINLDDTEYLWAGVGPPPPVERGGPPMRVFSHDDPRGRPEGALATAEERRRKSREYFAAERIRSKKARADMLGADLKMRRERVGITVQELASRIDVDPAWIENVEAGRTSLDVEYPTWIELVWATREPFPDPRRHDASRKKERRGFVGHPDLYLAEEAVRRFLEDDGR